MMGIVLLLAISFAAGYLIGMRVGLREGYRRALEGPERGRREARVIDINSRH